MDWRTDMENAPADGTYHVRGTWVIDAITKQPKYWQADHGRIDDHGEFVDYDDQSFGWNAQDYSHWLFLPDSPPPKKAK